MLDIEKTQMTNIRVTPKTIAVLGELCQAVNGLDEALEQINFLEPQRFAEHANFHNVDPNMPDVTLGELMNWVMNFACEEGPQLVGQQPAGEALVKARARQLVSMLKPLTRRVADIAESPASRREQPFVLCALAHPKVFWAVEEAYHKLKAVAE
jgi:hypothetical protein